MCSVKILQGEKVRFGALFAITIFHHSLRLNGLNRRHFAHLGNHTLLTFGFQGGLTMKFAIRAAVVFGVMICAASAYAQTAPVVAVIDIGKVFKNHPGFNAQMEAVKKQVTDYETVINQRKASLEAQKKKQAEYNSASAEYKRIEQAMAHDIADIQVQNNLKRKEILIQETRLYYETHKEITAKVSEIATQYGISLVLNYDSSVADPDDRAAVQRSVANPVVFQRNLDLTTMVIDQIKAAHPGVATRPAGPAPR